MRVDEGRRERAPAGFDHAVPALLEVASDLGDHAAVDTNVEDPVESLHRVEQARAADQDVVCSGASGEHHATPTAASTATGRPAVSRS